MKKLVRVNWDHFSGGVPPLAYFKVKVDELLDLSNRQPDISGIDCVVELCIIGLAAYFEAFCKDHFAAIINIVPQTLEDFTDKRECRIPVKSMLYKLQSIPHRLGFLIAEEYDFGTAKSVNSLFADLLRISPFSKEEVVQYSRFLNDRNLLVHHGGVFTSKYARQKFNKEQIEANVNMNSLIVTKVDVQRWAKFLFSIAEKLAEASSKALNQFGTNCGIIFPKEINAAIEALKLQ